MVYQQQLVYKTHLNSPCVNFFLLEMEQYRYSYGRKFNQTRIRNTEIKLPFKNGNVDWDWIENYIKGLKYSKYIEIK